MKRLWFVLLLVASAALATDQRPPVGKQRPAIERAVLQRPAGAEGGVSPFCPCYSAASMQDILDTCSNDLTASCGAPSITLSPLCSILGGGGGTSNLGTFTAVAASGQCSSTVFDILSGEPVTTTIATTPIQFTDCESILTPLCPLAAPAGLATSNPTLSTIDTSWNAVTSAAGYMLLRDGANPVTQATNATYTWTGLTASTTYQFTARTKNAAGVYGASTSNVPGTTSSTLASGLIAYYDLDETTGTRDDSVAAADLTDNNTVGSASTGITGTVAKFTAGDADYLSNAAPIIDAAQSFTICGWLYRPTATDGGVVNIDNATKRPYNIDVSGGTLRTYANGTATVSSTAPTAATWAFVCGNLNYAETPTYGKNHLFINAVDSGTPTNNGLSFNAVGVPFRIGARPAFGDNASPFHMTRWGVWQKNLSVSEQQSLMNGGTGKLYSELTAGDKTSLLAYWDMTEASGTRADADGNTYDLTDNNTVVSATSVAGSKNVIAASFTSASSESLSSTSSTLDPVVTYAFWMKRSGTFGGSDCLVCRDANRGIEVFGFPGQNYLRYGVHESGGAEIIGQSAVNVTDGNWHLVVAWADTSASKLRIQVDNGTVEETSFNGTLQADPGTLRVGGWSFGYYGGGVDEVGLWSRVLTAGERTELYNSGAGKFYPF